jgi:putative oxidoreductase
MNLARLQSIGQSVALLALRVALAVPFWRSGLTKWDGFLSLSDSTRTLFTDEFRLHILGRQIPYPMPGLFAHLAGMAEICLPILLVLGLGTRHAAAGILAMTGIIQLTEPDGWANFHLPWAAMALTLVVFGPGRFALDTLAGRILPLRLAQGR